MKSWAAAITLCLLVVSRAAPATDVEVQKTPTPKAKKVVAKSAAQKPGDTVSINPQPLPPKDPLVAKPNKGDAVSLNPQPLPPKEGTVLKTNDGDAVSLNPQPLPPKVKATKKKDQKVLQGTAQSQQPQ